MTIAFGMVLPWLLLAAGTWIGYQLVRQNGRILVRLEGIEGRLPARGGAGRQEARGLKLGAGAPDFELPDLEGNAHKLSELRGKDLLLIFFNPRCGFCTQMAGDLAALPLDGENGKAVPLVVTTGDAQENRQLLEKYGIRCQVLLQQEMEVASRYHAQGTPMGYRIDKTGRIASELTIGAQPLLALAGPEAQRNGPGARANGHKDYRSVAASRLNRTGLKAGTAAPDFRLPRIDDGELTLADYRGRRVLLVFSDPHCGPCQELAPRLQELHVSRTDLAVLMVSRGDVEDNRRKLEELGLTFPIGLQKKWEVSLKYAMFATPIGYVIDEQGVLASDVAVGIEPIMGLAAEQGRSMVDAIRASRNGMEAAAANAG